MYIPTFHSIILQFPLAECWDVHTGRLRERHHRVKEIQSAPWRWNHRSTHDTVGRGSRAVAPPGVQFTAYVDWTRITTRSQRASRPHWPARCRGVTTCFVLTWMHPFCFMRNHHRKSRRAPSNPLDLARLLFSRWRSYPTLSVYVPGGVNTNNSSWM